MKSIDKLYNLHITWQSSLHKLAFKNIALDFLYSFDFTGRVGLAGVFDLPLFNIYVCMCVRACVSN